VSGEWRVASGEWRVAEKSSGFGGDVRTDLKGDAIRENGVPEEFNFEEEAWLGRRRRSKILRCW
jgi:hypothetical protein